MNGKARIVITGDTHLGGGRVTEYALQNRAEKLFGDFLPLFKEADLAITNLESPVINDGDPIEKTGPALKSPEGSLQVLKTAGFGLVTLANNHIMDFGSEGLNSTIENCTKSGIETTGAGANLEQAKRPFEFEVNGIRISVINIAENEFGTTDGDRPGCHPLDPVQNYYSIQKAKESSDQVLVIVHGGHEHYNLPSPRMKQTYRFFADAGAGAVMAHHTHCPGGFEIYNGVPICYSLGNFLFDQPNQNKTSISSWNEGLIAELTVSGKEIDVQYHYVIQNGEKTGLRKLCERERLGLENKLASINKTILDDDKLLRQFNQFCKEARYRYSSYIEPHSIRVLHALRNRDFIPSLLTKKKRKLLLNLTRCEAHKDVLIKTLSS